MDRVEEGVANFRSFQADMRDFTAEWRGAQAEKEKIEKVRISRLTIALTIIGLLLAYLTWRVDAKRISEVLAPGVSQQHFQQDAGNSVQYAQRR